MNCFLKNGSFQISSSISFSPARPRPASTRISQVAVPARKRFRWCGGRCGSLSFMSRSSSARLKAERQAHLAADALAALDGWFEFPLLHGIQCRLFERRMVGLLDSWVHDLAGRVHDED